MIERIRNIAIIAHVDHGKTTLVDRLLAQSGALNRKNRDAERILDSNDQERERGITILAKNTAISWNGCHINIVDTPGHADFGGEVERILSMVDSVLLLVDAVEGPMPQTRFVARKAFEQGLHPIVVVNKIDRPGARAEWVVDRVFDLFDRLGATETQLDFPVIYASALRGVAGLYEKAMETDMTPLFQTIVAHTPAPDVDPAGPFQMRISALDYSAYVGVIGIGRIARGAVAPGARVTIVDCEGRRRGGRILELKGHLGLERVDVERAGAGEIVCVSGIDALRISDTLCDPAHVEALPPLAVDEPTVGMTFRVNDSPFAGLDGRYVTSRNIAERLERELLHNVALRVAPGPSAESFRVLGRGELHLSVLIETMRREGFELAVSRPEVVQKEIDGRIQEPYEQLVVECDAAHQGAVMQELGARKANLTDMLPDDAGRVRLEYLLPARGLLGFRTQFLTLTSGSGVMSHVFDHYGQVKPGAVGGRNNGVLISNTRGKALAYSLFTLQERGRLLIAPNAEVYEGQIVGLHARRNDLTVNPTRAKQLTNIRAAGSDENILLTPPLRLSLEQALELIDDDELVEATPQHIRLRKKHLTENDRKRAARGGRAKP